MTLRTITFDDTEWQVVPKNPVPAMIDSGASEVISPLPTAGATAGAVYIAMLAAAPEPPAQQPTPWLRVIDEALVVRHLGVADPDDDYITAKRKLHALFDWEIDVATDPPVGGDRVRKQQPITDEQIVNACYTYRHDFGLLPEIERHLLMAEARRWADAFGIGKGESNVG